MKFKSFMMNHLEGGEGEGGREMVWREGATDGRTGHEEDRMGRLVGGEGREGQRQRAREESIEGGEGETRSM